METQTGTIVLIANKDPKTLFNALYPHLWGDLIREIAQDVEYAPNDD